MTRNLIKHMIFTLTLSFLLISVVNLASAQDEEGEEATNIPLGPLPKLIVFAGAIVISVITDSILCLSLGGRPHFMRVFISSIPWAFINIYWWDYIAPFITGIPFLTMKFMQVGDPSWNYWIGSNVVVAFILNFLASQVVFRFVGGAAASPNWQDALLAGIDSVSPAVLFIVLPMFGFF